MMTSPMVFIVGNSRSGTTMMSRILNGSEIIFSFHELHFFEQMWGSKDRGRKVSREEAEEVYAQLLKNQRSGYLSADQPSLYRDDARREMAEKKMETLEEVFASFLIQEAINNGKTIPCDQTPRYVLFMKDILELYPAAKILVMVRDPRDVLLSQKKKWKRRFLGEAAKKFPLRESIRSWMNYHPITISKIWKSNLSAAMKYQDHPRVKLIKYEELLHQPQETLMGICGFLEIPYQEHMLEIPQVGSSSKMDAEKSMGINSQNIGKWKKELRPAEVFYCQQICQDEMEEFHYSTDKVTAGAVEKGSVLITFPVKLSLALLFNLNRMRNLGESIKRRLGS